MQGQRYMEAYWGQKKLDKSGFGRYLHGLSDTLAGLFATFGTLLKKLHSESRYVIDSFPLAVRDSLCHNTRIPRCKLLKDKAYYGRCASKRCWFYGFKVQVVTTTDGIPVDFYIHAGSEADQTGLRALPEGSVLYTDAGYTDYAGEDLFEEATGNRQQTARKKNSTRPHEPHENKLIQHFCKSIETCFSQLTARLSTKIHATTAAGFVLKLVLFIFVHAMDRAGV